MVMLRQMAKENHAGSKRNFYGNGNMNNLKEWDSWFNIVNVFF